MTKLDVCADGCLHPEAVGEARAALPSDALIARTAALLKAMSDPMRLKMLLALSRTPLCVHDLAVTIDLSESATSHALRLLRDSLLVRGRKDGRTVYYELADAHVASLVEVALEHARE